MPPAGSFSSREKGTKRRFFMSGLPSVGYRGRGCHPETVAPTLVCTSFSAHARRDDMRASPGSCAPRGASSVPAVVAAAFTGDRKGLPYEAPETVMFSIIREADIFIVNCQFKDIFQLRCLLPSVSA